MVLNVIYILASFLLIGVAVHGKVSGIVTNLPILDGITACGVLLLMASVVGLIGAFSHNKPILLFYMVCIFVIFLIQLSVSCASLAITENDMKALIKTAWETAKIQNPSLVVQAEQTFDCRGLGIEENDRLYMVPSMEDQKFNNLNFVFENYPNALCYHEFGKPLNDNCLTCYPPIRYKVDSTFNAAGGLGLFFSFAELVGGVVAFRFRHILASDPVYVTKI